MPVEINILLGIFISLIKVDKSSHAMKKMFLKKTKINQLYIISWREMKDYLTMPALVFETYQSVRNTNSDMITCKLGAE